MPEETLLILLINLTYCQYISDIYRFFFPTIELSMEIFTLGITDIRYFNKIWVIFPNISNLSLKKKKKSNMFHAPIGHLFLKLII